MRRLHVMKIFSFNGLEIAFGQIPINAGVWEVRIVNHRLLTSLTSFLLTLTWTSSLILRVIIILIEVRLIAVWQRVHSCISHVSARRSWSWRVNWHVILLGNLHAMMVMMMMGWMTWHHWLLSMELRVVDVILISVQVSDSSILKRFQILLDFLVIHVVRVVDLFAKIKNV